MPEKPIPKDLDPLNLAAWQLQFQEVVLPRLRRHAEVLFGKTLDFSARPCDDAVVD